MIQLPGLPTCAAICVYPSLVKVAKKALGDSGVKVASVSTAFPSGQAPKSVKIADTKFAVNEGADEIDMVISRGTSTVATTTSCSMRSRRSRKLAAMRA
jgi:deoxyribose-phosphate aldolase